MLSVAEILLVHLDAVDLLQLLDARLHLIRLGGFVAELLDELFGLLDHPLLVLVGRQLLSAPFGPQHDVFRVGDLVVVDLAQRELHGAVGHVVQKGPVVRDHQHGAVIVLQVLLEPLDRLDVEVVGGLVEQEDRRPPEQQLRQLDTHAPAARKLARGAVEVLAAESQTQQGFLDVGVARLAAQDVKMVVGVVQAVQQLLVLGRLVVGPFGDFGRQPLDLRLQPQHLLEGFGRLLGQRGRVGHLHLLGQVAHRALAVFGHGARRGLLQPHDQLQQGRLARAVLAHQTDAVLGVDQKRNIVEEGPAPVAYRKIVQ